MAVPSAMSGQRRHKVVRASQALSCRGFLDQPPISREPPVPGRYGAETGRRSLGFVLALAVELLLVAVVVTLGSSIAQRDEEKQEVNVVRFQATDQKTRQQQKNADDKPQLNKPDIRPAEKPAKPDQTPPSLAKPRQEEAAAPQIIQLSPRDMAAVDISKLPSRAGPAASANRSGMMGPVDTGSPNPDTPRVSGSGPNGEPLYAAAWYRKPYDDELAGYLSTASGPGWGLIACRTAPDYRVEDCVKVDEYPAGSNIARAVLAAAWQFKVRPPRIGGQPKIGEWVRIRIDYEFVPRSRN